MANLTQAALRSLIRKPGRYSDGGGLYFRVLGQGKAYWVYCYRVGGKERETSLGAFPELSLAEARDKHAALRKLVKTDKIDPIAQKRASKTVQPSTKPSFGQCADEYIRTREATWRNPKHCWQWMQTLTTHAAAIRDLPVDEVDTEAVLRVLTPLWTRVPETASRLRGRIEAVLASAQVDGWIPEDKPNAARWKNWLDRKLPKRNRLTRGHHKALAYAGLPGFWTKLTEIDTTASRALAFTILTACRTLEVLHMTWDEISFPAAVWLIPAERMKMDEPHDVPLSDAALSILGDQQAGRGKNSFVFPGRPRQPLSTMAMSMLLRRMGVDAPSTGSEPRSGRGARMSLMPSSRSPRCVSATA